MLFKKKNKIMPVSVKSYKNYFVRVDLVSRLIVVIYKMW